MSGLAASLTRAPTRAKAAAGRRRRDRPPMRCGVTGSGAHDRDQLAAAVAVDEDPSEACPRHREHITIRHGRPRRARPPPLAGRVAGRSGSRSVCHQLDVWPVVRPDSTIESSSWGGDVLGGEHQSKAGEGRVVAATPSHRACLKDGDVRLTYALTPQVLVRFHAGSHRRCPNDAYAGRVRGLLPRTRRTLVAFKDLTRRGCYRQNTATSSAQSNRPIAKWRNPTVSPRSYEGSPRRRPASSVRRELGCAQRRGLRCRSAESQR
jgi:hypothetical protein